MPIVQLGNLNERQRACFDNWRADRKGVRYLDYEVDIDFRHNRTEKCARCNSTRILNIWEKRITLSMPAGSRDRFYIEDCGVLDHSGLNLCMDCGQAQGQFPIPKVPLLGEQFEISQEDYDYLQSL